jgi:uncharacterized Ntn-hydrolase superfamily protein
MSGHVLSLVIALAGPVPEGLAPARGPARPVNTYSIVARDAKTGEIGVAVQSHWFSVGAVVPWAEAGVGAVATQSFVDASYGPLGLALMRAGRPAPDALAALLAGDPQREVRQVGMVDAKGNVATFTGKLDIPAAGGQKGEGYVVQANLMEKATVWPAMARAYEGAKGDLADRLLAALDAAQAEGGDIRGKQSAAILIVKAESTGKPWADRVFDLRVEDSLEPLKELRRLIRLRRAYTLEDQGDTYTAEKKLPEAAKAYEEAMKMAPDVVELQFWAAVSMYTNGREADALKLFRQVFAREKQWVDLVPRLAKAGLFPADEKKISEVQRQRPRSRLER